MEGLQFIDATPPVVSDPVRADIACFIGFVARRDAPPPLLPDEAESDYMQRALPSWVCSWLTQQDWNPGWHGRKVEDLAALRDIPVVIDSWDAFGNLFAWEKRPFDGTGRICHTALGAAVRSFFAGGGRRCYVVRLGDPWPYLIPATSDAEKLTLRCSASEALVPTMPPPTEADRGSWRGIGHLFGLPDVTFLCMPDAPEVFAVESWPLSIESEIVTEEHFVEAGLRIEPPPIQPLRSVAAPRCDENGFGEWAGFTRRVGDFLSRNNVKEVQFLAAVPLPVDERSLSGDPEIRAFAPADRPRQTALKTRAARTAQWAAVAAIDSQFVQLLYPWVRGRDTARLPGDLAAPDGLFAGILAANALTRGAWSSIVRQDLPLVEAVQPVLDTSTLEGVLTPTLQDRVRDRVTVFGPTAGGMRILSDVTSAHDESNRWANIRRLVSALVKAARGVGEQSVFENNGESLWNRLRDRFTDLMTGLWADGALSGAFPYEAFDVRCDRSTMTQADLDAGRVIVRICFTAAAPIVRIIVVFALNDGSYVSLLGEQVEAQS